MKMQMTRNVEQKQSFARRRVGIELTVVRYGKSHIDPADN
jgi:hypothetical protein